MARPQKSARSHAAKKRVTKSRAPAPGGWSSDHPPFGDLPEDVAAPLREQLGRAMETFASETGIDMSFASTDQMNRRAGVRTPDVAHEGLVPSPDINTDDLHAIVVGVVRLAGEMFGSPLSLAAPSAQEIAAIRKISAAVTTLRAARLRAQVTAVRASILTALADVYNRHWASWPRPAIKTGRVPPEQERQARAAMLEDIRSTLTRTVYRGVIGNLDELPLEAFAVSPAESMELETDGGAVKVAAEVLQKITGTSVKTFQDARRTTRIFVSRNLLPTTLALPHRSLAPRFADEVADQAAAFVRDVFRAQLEKEPGYYVDYGIVRDAETDEG